MKCAAMFDFKEQKWTAKLRYPCGTKVIVKHDTLSEFDKYMNGYYDSVKKASETITEFRRTTREELA